MTHVITLNYYIIDTCLIYKQMWKLSSFIRRLQPRFIKYLRKYPCVYKRIEI